ncbi:hypothetical protein GQ607_005378 [Colletotrichum asianum]|uniref:Uncharacterized protein n=1 Tax=Colletotrichum asianum TaxID=702518 RepID=A0A8H3ZU51_9PEZI|nr:hypothetical protein GQ607_005378 [Colletotrichum asianum]
MRDLDPGTPGPFCSAELWQGESGHGLYEYHPLGGWPTINLHHLTQPRLI